LKKWLTMTTDEIQTRNQAKLKQAYDYIIIGSGASGAVVAGELSKRCFGNGDLSPSPQNELGMRVGPTPSASSPLDPITSDAPSRICPFSQQGDDHELPRA
jgi:hypothetical protein